ncbi:spore germination protein (amino acid permease) [Melghiribacillus thermohalophilus]|uniref:Spore germination protein (Amino acid permease) n=1 Tax=Melghiribacillus thermohalophilus TaxID=1324956 RepID=A0A4V2V2N2_9BACI|nr:endospore germination permease [Melghiribacillus thermohalophilus]TCT25475.1 spore germination protein (amino acid permease) [Melghiribacillus thermohalophilus]
MQRSLSLSTTQITWIIVASAPVGINTLPRMINEQTEQTGWLFLVATALIIYLYMRLIIILPERYPGLSIFEITTHILGKWAGSLFILFLSLMMIVGTSLSLRLLADGIINYMLFHTPAMVIILFMLFVLFYTLTRGTETIVYINEILQPIILLTMTMIMFLVINKARFEELTPIISEQINVIQGSAVSFYPFLFIFVVVYFFPYVRNHSSLKKGIFLGISLILWISLTLFILSVTLFGTVELNYIEYPSIEFARLIQFPMLERFHIFYLIYWIIYAFTVHTVTLYAGSTGISYVSKKKNMVWIAVACTITFLISLYPDNIEKAREYAMYLNYVNLCFVFFAFPLLLLIDTIKRKVNSQ